MSDSRLSDSTLGTLWMIGAVFCFTAMTVAVRMLAQKIPVVEQVAFRSLIVLVVLVTAGVLPAEYLFFGVLVTAFVELSHVGNIRRLLAGTEPKIGQRGAPRGQNPPPGDG